MPAAPPRPPAPLDPPRPFHWALAVFVGTMAFSVLGTLLLKLVPASGAFFGPVYPYLVKAPTWTYMALLPVLSVLAYARTHPAALLAFFALWGGFVGGMSELIGTTTGVPFGPYSYTEWLGPKILGHVPYLIPGSWFAMSLLSYDLAGRLAPSAWGRVLTTALFMVLWDVALDPAMNRAFPFWSYPEGGFFYGMPASNWAGWFVVSVVIAWGYETVGGGLRATSRWAPVLYALNGLFPVLIAFLYGLPFGGVVGLVAVALPLLALAGRGRLDADDGPLPLPRALAARRPAPPAFADAPA